MRHHFELLKQAITTAPWLKHPDLTQKFVLACDASSVAVGCILYQPTDEGLTITPYNIVAVYSRKHSKAAYNYSAFKKELLSIVTGFKRFHSFLYLRKFIVITDHAPLKWIMQSADLPDSIHQWFDVLLNYNFEVVHRPGILNLPDALSRMYQASYSPQDIWGAQSSITFVEKAAEVLTDSDRISEIDMARDRLLSKTEVARRDRKQVSMPTAAIVPPPSWDPDPDISVNQIIMSEGCTGDEEADMRELRQDSIEKNRFLPMYRYTSPNSLTYEDKSILDMLHKRVQIKVNAITRSQKQNRHVERIIRDHDLSMQDQQRQRDEQETLPTDFNERRSPTTKR